VDHGAGMDVMTKKKSLPAPEIKPPGCPEIETDMLCNISAVYVLVSPHRRMEMSVLLFSWLLIEPSGQ
jgi:hypothetical protein